MSTHEIHRPRPELGPLDLLAGVWSSEALLPTGAKTSISSTGRELTDTHRPATGVAGSEGA
jgi:hypothetical protein